MKLDMPAYRDAEFLASSLRDARLDLEHAVGLFNELTDAEAVDYASYNLLAARTRYSYLLRLAKEQQLSV